MEPGYTIVQADFTSIIISLVISVALSVVRMLLTPKPPTPQRPRTETPRPQDGKYNLKQNVPHLSVVLGRVKKGSDYVWLAEKSGAAHHVMVWAGHRIEGYHQHYLHDEAVTLSDIDVIEPTHFAPAGVSKVAIRERLGLNTETPYNFLTTAFPTEWTEHHRGDGLASVCMTVRTVQEEWFATVYPQQMPQHSAVGNGALIYDPRDPDQNKDNPGTWKFSDNIALFRLFHLTHRSGGKWNMSDMYMADWIMAADVADEMVLNRDAVQEPRYHGGYWYRYDNDPVEVGKDLDEAGEMVVYVRQDGTIGVHPGRFTEPDIRVSMDDIISIKVNVNRSPASNVLAVRGQYTSPEAVYNTVDAAIWGDPYVGEDNSERTASLDNPVVQRHNHIQRLQKLKMMRTNATKLSLVVPWLVSGRMRYLPYRRFLTVHYPDRGLNEAIVEIMGRVRFSLSELTLSFDAIVVSSTMYDFNAATEEGVPPTIGTKPVPEGVPVPIGFTVAFCIAVTGVDATAYQYLTAVPTILVADARWTYVDDALTYEFEWQRTVGGDPPKSVMSKPGETVVQSGALEEGVEYKFRLRADSNGRKSEWTAYTTATAHADTAAPGVPTGFIATEHDPQANQITLQWDNATNCNLYRTELWRGTNPNSEWPPGGPLERIMIAVVYGGSAMTRSYIDAPPWLTVPPTPITYYYWVRSVNHVDVASGFAGPIDFTTIV